MLPPPRKTVSNQLTLDAALARLAAHDGVDGPALFGSRAGGPALPASDYDLLVLISALPVNIFQMLTHIDGRMTDVVFVLAGQADRLMAGAERVAPNTNDGRFLLKMRTAQIVYDASGRLARAQELARRGGWLAPSPYAAQTAAWFWLNHGLQHIRRMAQADDPVYATAVDLMLCANLSELGRAYATVRSLPWEGEKAIIRHLEQHDPAYLQLLRDCLAAGERERRVHLFEQLESLFA